MHLVWKEIELKENRFQQKALTSIQMRGIWQSAVRKQEQGDGTERKRRCYQMRQMENCGLPEVK